MVSWLSVRFKGRLHTADLQLTTYNLQLTTYNLRLKKPPMTPEEIVDKMYSGDTFSQWLGIKRLETTAGRCVLSMEVRGDMLNGFGIAHGGITYSLADSALAFASNSQGRHAVSIETGISHLQPVRPGDILTAIAEEENLSGRLGHYRVRVMNQEAGMVAIFRGTVFRRGEEWQAPT